jgi:hypothetical protein
VTDLTSKIEALQADLDALLDDVSAVEDKLDAQERAEAILEALQEQHDNVMNAAQELVEALAQSEDHPAREGGITWALANLAQYFTTKEPA